MNGEVQYAGNPLAHAVVARHPVAISDSVAYWTSVQYAITLHYIHCILLARKRYNNNTKARVRDGREQRSCMCIITVLSQIKRQHV